MKKTTYFAALAAMMTLLATGCNNGFNDAAVAAVAAGQRPGTGSSHVPSMPDGEIDDDGVLTKYTGSETAVVIPDGVTGIGYQAFKDCTSLESVAYGGTLAQWCAMDNDAYLMYYAKSVTVDGTDLKQATTLVIPDGVTSIGESAFYGCTSLESVTIPDGVTSIGKLAFEGCASLTSVEIPASVKSIGNYAFKDCTKLKEIQFNGTKAQWQAIEGCDTVAVPCIQCSDGYLGVKDVPAYLIMVGTVVTGYADGLPANLVIPDGVTSIGSWAFEGCASLASVTIPDSVTSIGWSAFSGCDKLTDVIYTGTLAQWCAVNYVSMLMSYAKTVTMSDGTDLKQAETLVIPDGATKIAEYAFYGCTSLASVTIPASVTSIERGAFSGCDKLTDVIYTGTLAQWCAVNGVSTLMSYAKTVTMSDGTDLKQATTLVIPNGVTSIEESTFEGCTSLASVTIPDGVKSIGNYAFERCASLTSVTYGGTKEEWGDIEKGYSIFYDTKVTQITDKDGVTFTVDKYGNITE